MVYSSNSTHFYFYNLAIKTLFLNGGSTSFLNALPKCLLNAVINIVKTFFVFK